MRSELVHITMNCVMCKLNVYFLRMKLAISQQMFNRLFEKYVAAGSPQTKPHHHMSSESDEMGRFSEGEFQHTCTNSSWQSLK